MKRAYKGTYHNWSTKHMRRCVNECCGRLNMRRMDTIGKMGPMPQGMEGKRLHYAALTMPNGLDSGATRA